MRLACWFRCLTETNFSTVILIRREPAVAERNGQHARRARHPEGGFQTRRVSAANPGARLNTPQLVCRDFVLNDASKTKVQ